MGFLVFVCIFPYALAVKKLSKGEGFAAALFGAFCALVLSSYLFVFLLGSYTIAPYVLVCGAGVLLAYFLFFDRGIFKDIWAHNRQVLLVYAAAAVVLSIVLFNASVWYYDEYNIWARAVKELYSFGGSYFNPFTNMRHRDYMPAYIPLQYCFVRVLGWKEATLYHVNAAAVLTACLAAIEAIRPKSKWAIPFFVVLVTLVLSLGDENLALNSLLAEVQLGVLFTCALLYAFFAGKGRQTTAVCIFACGTLVLLKSYTGLLFAGVLFAALLAIKLFAKKEMSFKALGLMLLTLLVVYSSWSVFYRYNTMKVEYEAGVIRQEMFGVENTAQPPRVTLGSFISSNPRNTGITDALETGLTDDFYTSAKNAADAFVNRPLSAGKLTALVLTAALLAAAVALMVIHRQKKLYYLSFLGVLAGLLAYVAGIFLTYSVQSETVSSFNRYYALVTLSLSVFVLYGLALLLEKVPSWKSALPVTAGLLALLLIFWGPQYLLDSIIGRTEIRYPEAVQAHERYSQYALSDGNILLVLGIPGRPTSDSTNALFDFFFLQDRISVLLRDEPKYASALDDEWFAYHTQAHLAKRVVIWVETPEYIEHVAQVMNVPPDKPMPWLFEVSATGGKMVYTVLEG